MIIPSLTFDGNAEQAFQFYKEALKGEFTSVLRFQDMPQADQLSDADKNKIMHIAMEAPDGIRLMGNDYMPFSGQPYQTGNNFTLSLHPDSRTKADEWFQALSDGGIVTMPLAPAFWGAYFGMFVDRFGVQWMINVPDSQAK
jgi:PhnB protein